jgi:ABC-type glycerol-3-phosphate transport system permease component
MQNNLKPYTQKLRRVLFGLRFNDGLIFKTTVYLLLIGIGFVYVYPLLHMLTMSFKDLGDLLSPTVFYLPTKFYTENFTKSYEVLRYFPTLMSSLSVTLIPAIVANISRFTHWIWICSFSFSTEKDVVCNCNDYLYYSTANYDDS